jgi:predicted DNA-binding antitoxin AbrB/MazE fold protein
MIQQVTAIYDHGVLRPLSPVELCDQEKVVLTIEKPEESKTEVEPSSLFDILNESGLIGAIKNAPPDLSANPDYLRGLGTSGD